MWAFDFLYQPFMAPISIWWLLSLFIPGLFKFMYGFWNGWSLAGIWFFNFFGLYWVDLWIMLQASVIGYASAKKIYNILPAFRAWFWTKTVTLLAHFVVFFMYHKKYRTYFKYMKKCPTNDCMAKKAEAKETEAAEDTAAPADDFFDF